MPEASVPGVRIPHSSARGTPGVYVKLISHIDPEKSAGFQYEGSFHKPGDTIQLPRRGPVIALECAGRLKVGENGRPVRSGNPAVADYRLWRYNRDTELWIELGRTLSSSGAEVNDLLLMATRAFMEVPRLVVNVPAAAARVSESIAAELRLMDVQEQYHLIAMLHDRIAAVSVGSVRGFGCR